MPTPGRQGGRAARRGGQGGRASPSCPRPSCPSTVQRVGQGRGGVRRQEQLWARLLEKAVDVAGPLVDRLAEACGAAASTSPSASTSARSGSLYNTLVYLGPEGIIHRHRKLMPTMHERVFHGVGAGDDLGVGRMPGRACRWPHLLGEPDAARPLARVTSEGRRSGSRRPPTTATAGSPSMRHIGIESGLRRERAAVHPRSAFPPTSRSRSPEARGARARRRGDRRPAAR